MRFSASHRSRRVFPFSIFHIFHYFPFCPTSSRHRRKKTLYIGCTLQVGINANNNLINYYIYAYYIFGSRGTDSRLKTYIRLLASSPSTQSYTLTNLYANCLNIVLLCFSMFILRRGEHFEAISCTLKIYSLFEIRAPNVAIYVNLFCTAIPSWRVRCTFTSAGFLISFLAVSKETANVGSKVGQHGEVFCLSLY